MFIIFLTILGLTVVSFIIAGVRYIIENWRDVKELVYYIFLCISTGTLIVLLISLFVVGWERFAVAINGVDILLRILAIAFSISTPLAVLCSGWFDRTCTNIKQKHTEKIKRKSF